jgi:hypothetical protein
LVIEELAKSALAMRGSVEDLAEKTSWQFQPV